MEAIEKLDFNKPLETVLDIVIELEVTRGALLHERSKSQRLKADLEFIKGLIKHAPKTNTLNASHCPQVWGYITLEVKTSEYQKLKEIMEGEA